VEKGPAERGGACFNKNCLGMQLKQGNLKILMYVS
jgi:hypothetical protein